MRSRLFAIRFMAVVLCMSLCTAQFVLPVRVYADEDEDDDDDEDSSDSSSSEIDELKRQIEETKEAKQKANETKSALASGMASVQQIIGSLQTEKNNVVTYVATLDAAMEQIQDDLNSIDTAIS